MPQTAVRTNGNKVVSNDNNINIYLAKGQVNQKGKTPSELATMIINKKEQKTEKKKKTTINI